MLHNYQENGATSLHPSDGVDQNPSSIPENEREYQEWLDVLLNANYSMEKLGGKVEDYRQYINKKPEKKRTSPSGLHLGIYNSLLLSVPLLQSTFTILSLALRHNILSPRWIQTHQLLL